MDMKQTNTHTLGHARKSNTKLSPKNTEKCTVQGRVLVNKTQEVAKAKVLPLLLSLGSLYLALSNASSINILHPYTPATFECAFSGHPPEPPFLLSWRRYRYPGHLTIQMMQVMQIAFLASPPLKNHLQHNLKKPSIRPPSSPSMCRVYVYLLRATPPNPLTTHFVRQAQLSRRLLRRLAFVNRNTHTINNISLQTKYTKNTHMYIIAYVYIYIY